MWICFKINFRHVYLSIPHSQSSFTAHAHANSKRGAEKAFSSQSEKNHHTQIPGMPARQTVRRRNREMRKKRPQRRLCCCLEEESINNVSLSRWKSQHFPRFTEKFLTPQIFNNLGTCHFMSQIVPKVKYFQSYSSLKIIRIFALDISLRLDK